MGAYLHERGLPAAPEAPRAPAARATSPSPPPMNAFERIAGEVGRLVTEKDAAYGSAFVTAGESLRLLYPLGIPPEKLGDALLLARIWDKMMRIATRKDYGGESPYRDISGYGVLGAARDQGEAEQHASGGPWVGIDYARGEGPKAALEAKLTRLRAELAQARADLASHVEALDRRCETLKAERDEALAQLGRAQELAR